ncbi:hypothetical protein GALMADRAFT_260362 [Galerina marginata CBS 339.88]|uniref:Uncharacterized protein n=1 Tax=Galerina marginata (strain CBS 339.88) TaxID=685588 RepID=A0A067SE43_GALM3|nr:hypothetical protein GALMADRAFT_260362 [Galerina marginata CBS 339.88]
MVSSAYTCVDTNTSILNVAAFLFTNIVVPLFWTTRPFLSWSKNWSFGSSHHCSALFISSGTSSAISFDFKLKTLSTAVSIITITTTLVS